jgi:HEAT repeat protein
MKPRRLLTFTVGVTVDSQSFERDRHAAMDGSCITISRCCAFAAGLTSALLAGLGGCTPYIGTTYKSFIRHVRENPDPNIRYTAYAKLGVPGIYESAAEKDEAIRVLIAKFKEGREPVAIRAAIIRSLGNLGDARARDVVVAATADVDNAVIRVEACRALGRVGLPEDATLLSRIMLIDRLEDCRIAAIESLGRLKTNDPRVAQMLLDGLESEDPAIRFECLGALRAITNKDFGTDPVAWRRALESTAATASNKSATGAEKTAKSSAPTERR